MIEALGFAVSDGAVGKQRGIAAPASIEQNRHAANIEERFLLAGEACVRQILGRRARAHRDIRIGLARSAAEFLVGLGDGRGEFSGPRAAQKSAPMDEPASASVILPASRSFSVLEMMPRSSFASTNRQ